MTEATSLRGVLSPTGSALLVWRRRPVLNRMAQSNATEIRAAGDGRGIVVQAVHTGALLEDPARPDPLSDKETVGDLSRSAARDEGCSPITGEHLRHCVLEQLLNAVPQFRTQIDGLGFTSCTCNRSTRTPLR